MPIINQLLASLPIGNEVEIHVLRDGAQKSLTVKPVLRQNRMPQEHELQEWGIAASDISFILSKELKRDNQNGVFIGSVRPGGPAGDAKPQLRYKDVIIKMGDTSIASVEELRTATTKFLEGATEPIPVLTTFQRGSETLVTVVKVGISELNDPGLEVKKAWLPVKTQVLTRDIAKAISAEELKGFRVIHVYPESTAEKAGLKDGDIIFSVDGEALTADAPEHYEELPALIRAYRAGTTVKLGVQRGSDTLELNVELIRSPKLAREMKKFRDNDFEFTVRNTTFFDDSDMQWEGEQSGVLVEEVVSGGWAALGLLQTNDLVQSVDNVEVKDVDQFRDLMEAVANAEQKAVVLKVLRGIYTIYVELEPDWSE